MTKVTKGLCLYKNSDPKGLSVPAPWLYTCIKTWKIMYKIRLQRYFVWHLQQMGKVTRLFSWHQDFVHKEFSAPAPELYKCGKTLKMCIKSEFKEICLKLATNGRSDKGFLLTSKVCPQGLFCPCPGAIYIYKIINNVIKSYFKEIILKLATYGQREKAFLLSSKCCPQWIVCPSPGLNTYGETWKKCI